MSIKKKALAILASVLAVFAVVIGGVTLANAAAGDTPAHSKKLTANGDGTYTLELSVTGDADYDAEPVKANVIIVLDTSGSMDFLIPSTTGSRGSTATDGDTRDNNFQLYKRSGTGYGATYTAITDAEAYTDTVYYQWGRDYYQYDGTRYSSTSRMTATKTSVNNLIDTLASQNTTANPDTIEMSLITFASDGVYRTPGSATANNWVSGNGQSLKTTVSNLNASGGTNWDDALYRANNLAAVKAQQQPTEKVYVVFFSDGEPTFSNTTNNNDSPTSHTHGTSSNNGGGQSGGTTTQNREANSAYYHANQIHNATYDSALYGIFAFGTEESYMKNAISYGNYGDASHAGSVEGSLYFNANSEDDIKAAFSKIAESIIEAVGITDVSITDGTTNKVATSTGVSELLEVEDDSFEYWLSWNVSSGTNAFKSFIGGKEVDCTATVSGNNIVITWGEGANAGTATYEGTKTGDVIKVKWTEKTDFYNYDPPAAQFNSTTGAVDWKLDSVGTLLNGVTYSVTFDVYPSQETLDDVADIKNNPGPNGAWKDLDPAVQQYIDQNGNLKTNTTATLTYSDTRLDNPGPKTTEFTNPDPVENAAVEQMAVTKEWDNQLESDWKKPSSITLDVTRDGDPHYTVTLADPSWNGSVYVSIGIMGEDGKPLPGSEGHDFTFTEPQIAEGFRWEIDAPTVHPMLINNVPTMLIKVDASHSAPAGATTYTFNNATYYVDSAAGALTATNERRSSINLVKAVDGEDAPEDAIFPFTLNVIDPLAPETAPTEQEDPGHDSDYWIWISVWDKNSTPVTSGAVVSGATSAGGGWYYGVSGQDIVLNVKDGYSIRINNVPTGTKYTITEGNTTTPGFTFDSAEIAFKDGKQPNPGWTFSGGKTSTGSVDSTNAIYTITYNNTYELSDIEVNKVWDDNSDQDGIRPENLTLTLNGAPAGTTVPTPTITKSEDGNTWTYKWSGLPRYDSAGEEIEYTVTEGTVPDGYTTTGSPAKDHGTITNTHEPEVIEVTVKKVWNDSNDIGKIRPASINAQLTADGAASGDPVVLNDDNEWTYTWEDLPKYKDGKEIVYTADETAVPAGYTKTNTYAVVEGGSPIIFTVTNTYSPTPVSVDPPVQKVITGNDNLYNKGDFTFTITGAEGAPMPKNTSITNSETYELANKPGFYEFGEIEFTMPGTYEYTITESGSVEGVTNDKDAATGKTITFTVTDDGTGKLVVSPTTDQVQLSFTNVYDADGEASIVVSKEIAGAAWPAGKTLTLTIAGANNAPMPETTTASLTAAGSVTFGPIAYGLSDAGKSYEYTITESSFGAGWSGSPTSVKATVAVTDNGDGTLKTTVTYSPEDAKFTNTYEASGTATLEATKAIEGAAWPKGKTLTMTLAGTDSAPMPAAGGETVTLTAAGKATFGVITYDESDAGKTYTYTISEDGFGTGWTGSGSITATVKVEDNGDGTLKTTVTYSPDDATITNTYEAEGTAVLEATKAIEGAAWPANGTITFTLAGEGGTLPATKTVTLTAAGKATFGAITYDESDAGKTYTYTISEDGFGTGWTGSGSITATVKVEDNGDGTLKTAVTYSPENATITNTYKATGEIELFAGKKLDAAEGLNAPDVSGKYTLTLEAQDNAPMPAGATDGKVVITNADGDGTMTTFGKIAFTEADAGKTYTYKVTETGTVDGVTNGTASYDVTVTVTDNGDGTLSAEATPNANTLFTNTYSVKPTEIVLSASKTLEVKGGDNAPDVSGKYTLTLTDAEGNVVDTKTNPDGKGTKVDFKAISFDAPGTYTFTVAESGTVDGVTNGTASYDVTVTVTDNGDGTLSAAVTSGDQVTGFINTYDVEPTEFELSAAKILEVKAPANNAPDVSGKYTLAIVGSTEDTPMPENTTITNVDGKGTAASFGAIKYTTPGEYQYTITETGTVEGVTNGQTSYTVIVKVTDNGDGTLSAAVTSGNQVTTFTNTYSVTPVTLPTEDQFTVNKSLTGTPLTAGAFEFVLTGADGAPMPEKTAATNDASGKVVFDTITYDTPGTYTYTIAETDGGAAGYTYDTNNVTVTVTVVDNGKGALEATVAYGDGTTFENTYEASGDVTLTAAKELNGRALEEGQFTYELVDSEGNVIDTQTNNGSGAIQFKALSYDQSIFGDEAAAEDTTADETAAVDTTEDTTTDETFSSDPAEAVIAADDAIEAVDEPAADEATDAPADDAIVIDEPQAEVEEETNPIIDVINDIAGFFGLNRLFAPTVAKAAEGDARTATFTYTIREVNDGQAGYTYDAHEINVTVTVVDNGDGTLTATPTYEGETTFVNTYKAEGEVEFENGTKIVEGKELEEGQFSFQLTDADNNVIETVTNDADGNFVFSNIAYTEADAGKTFTYQISEINDGKTGYTYDATVYEVTVTVTDNGDGTLTCQATYGDADEIVFTNPYEPLATSAELKGQKTLEGKKLEADMFEFELRDEEGNVVATVKNAADGSIDFGTFEFDEEGTFTYTAKEIAGTDANMTYDTADKVFTITVVDEDGQLVATVECEGGQDGVAQFKNTYKEPENPPKTPEVPKTGDTTPIVAIEAMAGFAVAMLAGGFILRRRYNK